MQRKVRAEGLEEAGIEGCVHRKASEGSANQLTTAQASPVYVTSREVVYVSTFTKGDWEGENS